MTLAEVMEVCVLKAGVAFDVAFVGLVSEGLDSDEASLWATDAAADEFDREFDKLVTEHGL